MWNNVDLKSSWKWILSFAVYTISLTLYPNIAFSEVYWQGNYPVVSSNVYLYLQFFACIFIVNITSSIFGESFRRSTYEYLLTYPLSGTNVIVIRVLKLLGIICIIYIPVVLYLFSAVNRSIKEYIEIFPQYTGFPLINIFIPIVHCLAAIIFYITTTLFLLHILKNDKLPTIFIMAYCALEAGPLNIILGRYDIFRGSFNTQDYYVFFPPNIIIMIALSIFFTFAIMITYRRKLHIKCRYRYKYKKVIQ